MSVGTSTKTLTATASSKKIAATGTPVWFRNLVTLTLTGFGSHNPSNLVLLAYRGSTLVALCEDFAGSPTATGTMDLNTTELETVMDSVWTQGARDLAIFLFNSDETSLEMVANGTLRVYKQADYSETVPVSPISGTTVFIGNLAIYNGKTYLRDTGTGLYHEFAAATMQGSVTETLDSEGITIPGAP